MTLASSSSIERLLGRVLAHPSLPPDIRADLERWDAAVGRGEDQNELAAWADRLTNAIDALDAATAKHLVVGYHRSSAPPPSV